VAGRLGITARRRAAAALAIAAAALSLAAAAPLTAAAAESPGWTTWGNGTARQSRASASLLKIGNADKLKLAWSRPLGGVGAAQPLYLRKIAIKGKQRDIYVATSESGLVSAFDALTGKVLWTHEVGSVDTGCLQMPKGIFGVTGTPVYDPTSGYIYLAATSQLWAIDAKTGEARQGWPVAMPMDQYHEHVWGALALGNGHVYFGIASYCDRRPYSGRVLAVSTKTGAVDHSWTAVDTGNGEPAGGGIWGWGGVAIAGDGHIWAAVANANIAPGASESVDHAESVVELSSSLALLSGSHATGMPERGDFGFGSTPVIFRSRVCGSLVAAEGKDGAVYLWRTSKLAAGPVQRLVLAFPATLYGSPAWDPITQQLFLTTSQGYSGVPGGLSALALTKGCKLRVGWTKKLGGQLSAIPTVVNNTVVVATGTGHLRVYAAATGRLVTNREVRGAVFAAPMAIGRDVAVVTWTSKLMVYRLPANAK
jgi:outer membrane protein assembly factor BamB